MKTPHTFVLVPSYNHARFVAECLRSIIEQTVPPKQLLVIDDGSQDDSPRIIERILKDCPFPAELIVRANKGLTRTLNEGFAKSTGKYFAYLGSDDYWMPEFLENRQRLFAEHPFAGVAYGNSFVVDEGRAIRYCTEDWEHYAVGDIGSLLYSGCGPMSSSVVYRREAIDGMSWDEGAKLEDYDFYLRVFENSEFVFEPQTLSAWRQHGTNTSVDREMILRECLAAQSKNLALLASDELQKIQSRTKLQHMEVFLQRGKKREALRHMREDKKLLVSVLISKRHLAKLVCPQALINFNQWILKNRSTRTYGRR